VELSASAPGKAFVTGEYGVARGGPAVVVATAERVYCHIETRPGEGWLNLRRGELGHRVPLSQERVDEIPGELRFAVAALLVSARAAEIAGVDLTVETRSELDAGRAKSGLGGSAAVTAAVVAGVHAMAGRRLDSSADLEARVAEAIVAHRLAQGGGSAADAVCATVGGIIRVEGLDDRDAPATVAASVARARTSKMFWRKLRLPSGLALELAATGEPAASGPRIARFGRLLDRERSGDASVLERSGSADAGGLPAPGVLVTWCSAMRLAVEEFIAACAADDADALLRGVRTAGELLARLGAIAGIPILTAGLRRACLAGAARAAVKPSGAGGGDCAIAALREEDREWLRSAWRAAGLRPIAVDALAAGARREPAPVVHARG
jgi:phosphomevalonate kinase